MMRESTKRKGMRNMSPSPLRGASRVHASLMTANKRVAAVKWGTLSRNDRYCASLLSCSTVSVTEEAEGCETHDLTPGYPPICQPVLVQHIVAMPGCGQRVN